MKPQRVENPTCWLNFPKSVSKGNYLEFYLFDTEVFHFLQEKDSLD